MAFNGMFVAPEDDPRTYGSPAGELATYREYLANSRLTLELKCSDLTAEQLATRSVPPSNLSLLGLVRHMAAVENTWFVKFFQSRWDEPRLYRLEDDHDFDFNGAVGTQDCVDDGFRTWKAEIAKADAWLATRSDADLGDDFPFDEHHGGGSASVRDILVHMVEEYARHCGHADLLRECLDGRTGE